MGDRVDHRTAGQHPDLSSPSSASHRGRIAVLTLLALDGVLCAVASAFFLPLRLGAVPFPVSAVLAGAVNVALVWAALHWTSEPRLAALPLWTWLATVAVLTVGGPGDDIVFGGVGVLGYALLLLLVLGGLPPAYLLYRRTRG